MPYRGTYGLTHVSIAGRQIGPPPGMGRRRGVQMSKWQKRRAIGLSLEVILERLAWDGRGIVRPSFPTCGLSWELAVTWSRSRDEKGRRLARSTYSPFVMAVMQLLERCLR